MVIKELRSKKLINPPKWLPDNCHYLTIMGSNAYGVSNDSSDFDIYGFAVPPKTMVFPHLAGEIQGFGKQKKRFEQYEKHHVFDKDALGGKGREYDFSIYSIVKYFSLAMENNPNIIDSLYTPLNCILHITKIGNMIRENRDMFLHKGAWHRFKGYAFSQLNKVKKVKNNELVSLIRNFEESRDIPHFVTVDLVSSELSNRGSTILASLDDGELNYYNGLFLSGHKRSTRFQSWKQFNTDVKFLYHVVRLLDEIEQILTEGTIDLQRNREQLKAIRRGDYTEEQIQEYFDSKERELETLYTNSNLRYSPDEDAIKQLLINCLEEHYGSISNCVILPNAADKCLNEIQNLLDRYNNLSQS